MGKQERRWERWGGQRKVEYGGEEEYGQEKRVDGDDKGGVQMRIRREKNRREENEKKSVEEKRGE